MSPRVSLSLRSARHAHDCMDPRAPAAIELERAISKAERSSSTRLKLKQPKAEKRALKRDETITIREAVMCRAHYRCERCDVIGRTLQLDHFFGRGKVVQTVENCWALCWLCHKWKTQNTPTAVFWLRTFAKHCDKFGYSAEAERARTKLAWAEAKAATP